MLFQYTLLSFEDLESTLDLDLATLQWGRNVVDVWLPQSKAVSLLYVGGYYSNQGHPRMCRVQSYFLSTWVCICTEVPVWHSQHVMIRRRLLWNITRAHTDQLTIKACVGLFIAMTGCLRLDQIYSRYVLHTKLVSCCISLMFVTAAI